MRNYKLILMLLLTTICVSCVQKSSKKTVVVRLNVAGITGIKTVGLRGSEKPLSWDYDLELQPIIKDSFYEGYFSLVTGYKFTEVKFTINEDFELKDKDNRQIIFSEKDTTIYEALYNLNSK
jgi:hypothetical protein